MLLELKPEQASVLERAARSGMSPEDVLDQAFALIQEQFADSDWMHQDQDAIAAQVAEGYEQAQRGELLGAEEAWDLLQKSHAQFR
jgi:predicted transcriptional regulator